MTVGAHPLLAAGRWRRPTARACTTAARAGSGHAGTANAAADQLRRPLGQRQPGSLAGQRADTLARHPAVRGDVEHPVETLLDRRGDRRREIVEVEELRRRVVLREAGGRGPTRGRGEPRAAVARRRRWPGGAPWSTDRLGAAPPLLDELLGRCELAGEHELDVGSQHRLLGERHGVVRRCPVDHRRRHEHHVVGVRRSAAASVAAVNHVVLSRCAGTGVVVAAAQVDDHVDVGDRAEMPDVSRRDDSDVAPVPSRLTTRRRAGTRGPTDKSLGSHGTVQPRWRRQRRGDSRATPTTIRREAETIDGRSIDVVADDDDPNEAPIDDPFAGLPMFGDLARALSGQGPLNWDAARQFALLLGGSMLPVGGRRRTERRSERAHQVRRARRHRPPPRRRRDAARRPRHRTVRCATPEQWALQTLDAYRPLFTELATSLGPPTTCPPRPDDDPMAAMMAGLGKMMAPAMLGMSVGSMVGNLARSAFGVYDLPIPRATPSLVFVPATIDRSPTRGRSTSTRCGCG